MLLSVSSGSARSELGQTLWAFRREFAVVGWYSLVANVLMLTPTLYMLQVYDRVMVSRSELTLLVVSVLALLLLGFMALAEWLRSRVLVRVGQRIDDALSNRVFQASFDASLRPNEGRQGRAFADLTELRQFLTGNGVFALFDTPWAPIYIAVLMLMHPMLGWLAVAFAGVQLALAWWGQRAARAPAQALHQSQTDENRFLQSKLRNAEVVQAMGMLPGLKQRWQQRHDAVMQQHAAAQATTHRVAAWSKFVRYCQQSLMLGAGALLVIDGELSPGAMIAANVLAARALAPIDMLAGTWKAFLSARLAYDRLRRLLQDHPTRDLALRRVAPRGRVELRGVVARAPGRDQPILHGIDLTLEPGTVTVVMGPSGSGKSTLARVVVGIWPDVQGEVLLDEHPLQSWSRVELGGHLGYLPQDIELFDGTIAQNIARMGQEDPQAVVAAAKITGLHPTILRFPKGYDTPMGEAGQLLSGGQRQRVALARALYGNPALVVLDEPNANLDDAGEAALQHALRALREAGRTVLVVSHRPGVLNVADRVVVMREGRIEASGARDDVMARLAQAAQAAALAGPHDNDHPHRAPAT
ncbi:ATP-binding cassette subfamily C exporter for protease/lipase [Tepidimonas ignava]|uniref:ATP-binding cassette subfamily C exporter for protease/lipase n=3 Tax=Tepidimonas ignava TaxID=114249 RepID=A0A4R3LC56_9BURK|nr:ATP-binding cassette subfamily C exporter for protease/lipase [Tepidimonas ignava]TSE22094.1 Type I secretion system ATP-binding protein PrsD [Tepidimonas ignava]